MKIRVVKSDDFNTLAPMYVEAYNSLNIGENWDKASAKKLLLHLYHDQPDLFFVAVMNGEVVGAISALVKPWWDGNHLTDGELFVHPAYQRKGIGKQLIQYLFTKAKQKYQAVAWDTFTHTVHDHPLKWCRSMGFQEINEWTMISANIEEVLTNLTLK